MIKKTIFILVLGILLSLVIFFTNSCYVFKMVLLLISFILVCIAHYKLLCSKSDLFYILYIPICIVYFVLDDYISHKHVLETNPNHYKVIASVTRNIISKRGYLIDCYYEEGGFSHAGTDVVSEYEYKSIDSIKIIIVDHNRGRVTYEWNPTAEDIIKYSKPVYYRNEEEIGNDSYEYAISEHDIAFKNFGFNIVQIATSVDNNTIVVTKLNGEKCYIPKKNNTTDTFLVYSNINPEFYDGWHVHSHSTKNIAKIKESGYGYLFRGKIYSATETEKYWNIIEQYKLRQ